MDLQSGRVFEVYRLWLSKVTLYMYICKYCTSMIFSYIYANEDGHYKGTVHNTMTKMMSKQHIFSR